MVLSLLAIKSSLLSMFHEEPLISDDCFEQPVITRILFRVMILPCKGAKKYPGPEIHYNNIQEIHYNNIQEIHCNNIPTRLRAQRRHKSFWPESSHALFGQPRILCVFMRTTKVDQPERILIWRVTGRTCKLSMQDCRKYFALTHFIVKQDYCSLH